VYGHTREDNSGCGDLAEDHAPCGQIHCHVARWRYHICMTSAMTVRLDDETSRELAELAERHPSRSAAVQAAIHQAWQRLQEEKLQAGYAAAVADNPHYPYESAEEAAVLRARRRARQARDSAA
jgi:predicted transcriptional regulator